nr:DUF1942 domain-containing protein [Mycobacterium sp. 141]
MVTGAAKAGECERVRRGNRDLFLQKAAQNPLLDRLEVHEQTLLLCGPYRRRLHRRTALPSSPPRVDDLGTTRAVNSSTYADMKGNQTDGLPNQPIAPGTQTSGGIYFDVRGGTAPDSVVYRDAGGTDKVVWKG